MIKDYVILALITLAIGLALPFSIPADQASKNELYLIKSEPGLTELFANEDIESFSSGRYILFKFMAIRRLNLTNG